MHDPIQPDDTKTGQPEDPTAPGAHSSIDGGDSHVPPAASEKASFTGLVVKKGPPPLTLTRITSAVQAALGNDQIRINRDPGREGQTTSQSFHAVHMGAPDEYGPRPIHQPRPAEYIIALPLNADQEAMKTRLVAMGVPAEAITSISGRTKFYHTVSLHRKRMAVSLVRSTRHHADPIDEVKAHQIVADPAELTRTVNMLFTISPEKHRRWQGYEGMEAAIEGDRIVIRHVPQDSSLQAVFELEKKEFTSTPEPINGLIVNAGILERAVQKSLNGPAQAAG